MNGERHWNPITSDARRKVFLWVPQEKHKWPKQEIFSVLQFEVSDLQYLSLTARSPLLPLSREGSLAIRKHRASLSTRCRGNLAAGSTYAATGLNTNLRSHSRLPTAALSSFFGHRVLKMFPDFHFLAEAATLFVIPSMYEAWSCNSSCLRTIYFLLRLIWQDDPLRKHGYGTERLCGENRN